MPSDPTDIRGELADARASIERARRQRVTLIATGTAMAVIAVAIVGLWLTGTTPFDSGKARPALAERVPVEVPSTSATTAAPFQCRTPLSFETPLRLWIGGDSLAGSLGPSLGNQTALTGVVQPTYDSRPSSGLSSPEFFDWPRHAQIEMARLNPEIAVFIIGANDWTFPSAQLDSSGEPAWKARYALLVEEMISVLSGPTARPVYWVGAPTMEEHDKDVGVRAVNDVARQVIARHDNVRYIDAYTLFSDSDGHYTDTLPGPNGKEIRVRAGDGIHFTPEGGDLLAEHVFGPLDERCSITRQAAPGRVQPVIEAPGSSQVPGTSRNPTSSPTTTRAPVTTRPPVTAPPTTAAPTTSTSAPGISLPVP